MPSGRRSAAATCRAGGVACQSSRPSSGSSPRSNSNRFRRHPAGALDAAALEPDRQRLTEPPDQPGEVLGLTGLHRHRPDREEPALEIDNRPLLAVAAPGGQHHLGPPGGLGEEEVVYHQQLGASQRPGSPGGLRRVEPGEDQGLGLDHRRVAVAAMAGEDPDQLEAEAIGHRAEQQQPGADQLRQAGGGRRRRPVGEDQAPADDHRALRSGQSPDQRLRRRPL